MSDKIKEENRQDIRIVVAGHVDHGKSTVIGRLLADIGALPQGKLEQIQERCRRSAKPFEYAFLLDALKDEQAQGVTIDSARCFFRTQKRDYILIDAPGHTEFIKNMVTGASRAEAAVIVIDAAEGIRDNSKRHGIYLSLLGMKQVCVLINKMDLVEFKEERFNEIARSYADYLSTINMEALCFIPVSGFNGDNIVYQSEKMKWYKGRTLFGMLEAFDTEASLYNYPFRMPVQDVYKFTENGDQRRIIAGTVEAGYIKVGDEIVFYPSGKSSCVKSIESFNTEQKEVITAGYATGFTLEEQIYIKKGELAVRHDEAKPLVGSRFRVTLFWLSKRPVREGNDYLFKLGETKTGVRIEKIFSVMDATDAVFKSGQQINNYEIAQCVLTLEQDIAFDTSDAYPTAGRFVLVEDYNIAGGGLILEKLQPPEPKKLFPSIGKVTYDERCRLMGQRGIVLWLTGLSGAGKSTIAIELERELYKRGKFAYRLDGDNLRDGLNSDLGFSLADRTENIRRVSETAKLFRDSGMLVLVSFISPLRSMREMAKQIIGEENFVEIYVKAQLSTCIERDTKGLYQKAIDGKIKNFTGISSPYEEPDCPDIVLDTDNNSVEECVNLVLEYLEKSSLKTDRGIFNGDS